MKRGKNGYFNIITTKKFRVGWIDRRGFNKGLITLKNKHWYYQWIFVNNFCEVFIHIRILGFAIWLRIDK